MWRVDRGDARWKSTRHAESHAFTVSSVGRYRIDVTMPMATSRRLQCWPDKVKPTAKARPTASAWRGARYSFSGTGLRDYEYSDIRGAGRIRPLGRGPRSQLRHVGFRALYVSRDVIGYQDLDPSTVAGASSPITATSGIRARCRAGGRRIAPDTGRGSTRGAGRRIDEAPWGFAPYRYGR